MKQITLFLLLLASSLVQAKNIEIHMKNNGKDGLMVFEPGFSIAQPGDTVTFIPTDRTHNSASFLVPTGAKPWLGKMDEKLVVKLEKEGLYLFKCDPHLPMGMAGMIQVGTATNKDAAKTKIEEVSKSFAMNKDRLVKYLGQAK